MDSPVYTDRPQACIASRLVVLAFVFASVGSLSSPVPAQARQRTELTAVAPIVACSALPGTDISAAVGAKTHITAANVVETQPGQYCRVTGYVEPTIKFEVRLPTTTWTQRFVQNGCGGLCGMLSIRLERAQDCYPAQHGELALASTDMGHTGGNDGIWAETDYQLRIDFAYRGVHLTTLAAKAVIAEFYGKAPKYSYFAGCSDGGREALMEAQRYPNDFNGITAGAAAMNFVTQNTFYHGWNALKNVGADGQPILTAVDLPILHRAAVEACDAADGLKDGLISDPFSCRFDPSVVECKADAVGTNCLTHAQVEAAKAIYQGANDGHGHKMGLSGPLPGSELAWAGVYVPNGASGQTMSAMISTGVLKYLAFERNPPSSFSLTDLEFTPAAFAATTELHGLYDSTDPDLSPFAKAGGKLMLWHGLADPHISPLNSVAYYTAMNQVMGENAVQQFARLYLFPGGYHCNGGEGPFAVDLLSPIMTWVEQGVAPFALVAGHEVGEHRPGDTPNGGSSPKVDRRWPVFPYPITTKYKGSGSFDEASSYEPGAAKPVSAAQLQWLGSSFYKPHYERWCQAQGSTMTCTAKP